MHTILRARARMCSSPLCTWVHVYQCDNTAIVVPVTECLEAPCAPMLLLYHLHWPHQHAGMRLLGKGRGMLFRQQRNHCLDEAGYKDSADCLLAVSSMSLKWWGSLILFATNNLLMHVPVWLMLHKTFSLPTNQPSICHIMLTAVSMQSKGAKLENWHSLQYAIYAASQEQLTRGLWGLLKSIMYYSYYSNFQVKASCSSVENVRRTDMCQVAGWWKLSAN